jgi:hypothetical protein
MRNDALPGAASDSRLPGFRTLTPPQRLANRRPDLG